MGLFDVFKDKDEDSDDGGMTEEYSSENTSSSYTSEPEPAEEATPPESSYETPSTEQPVEETTSYSQTETAAQSQIGIEQLMGKRFKLEEAIDYVGGMIKDLKEKRTNLVKNIEDESVDIKNLKEKAYEDKPIHPRGKSGATRPD